MLMTKAVLQDICKQHKLYKTPSLNDKLFCHFKGFTQIANLEEYTALRALFLEGNALDSLEGLGALKELRCLYVQQNCIASISGLEQLENLDTLNISHNQLQKLENLACCPNLCTLICTNNQLSSVESVQHLAECKGLHTLDLQNNNISDPAVLDVLKELPELKCLYLKGNPVVATMKNYRKSIIAALPSLTYLDERPVFEDERRLVTAWVAGGLEAERAERKAIREEEEARNARNFEMMQAIRREGWRKRREKEGLAPGDTDPTLDELSDDEYVFQEEPAELVEARQRLAAFTARQGEEEPPELTSARISRAQAGGAISESHADAGTGNDGLVYLESVKAAQQDLVQGARDTQRSLDTHVKQGGSPLIKEIGSKSAPLQDDTVDDEMPALELISSVICPEIADLD